MLQVEILHQAEVELWDTAKYYESKSSGLGVDFLNEMEEAILFIQEAPLRQPESDDHTRRVLTKRFPYQVIYTIHDEKYGLWYFQINVKNLDTGKAEYRQNNTRQLGARKP